MKSRDSGYPSQNSDPCSKSNKGDEIQVNKLLPPANEVWGKVTFSQACVIPSVRGWGVGVGLPACITGHMTREFASGGSASRGVCIWGDASGGMHLGGLHPRISVSKGLNPAGLGQTPCWNYEIQLTSEWYVEYWICLE